MSTLEIIVSVLRGVHVAALVSLFGTLTFVMAVAPDVMPLRRTLLRLATISAISALLLGLAWLVAESAEIAGANDIAMTLRAIPVVALRTHYGQWFLLRVGLLIAVRAVLRVRRGAVAGALALSGVALAIQPMLGHAGATGGSLGVELIASEALHLLAAGAWLGGLVPLLIAVGMLPEIAAAAACRGFTPIGLSAILVLAGTAIVQITEFIGSLPGLFGTGYGHIALVKLALFFILLTLAALNRFILTDRLAGAAAGRQHMRISIAIEAVLGALVIVTAGFLASSTPGTHEQPVWPFAWRASLDAFDEPVFRRELVLALIAFAGAIAIAAIGVARRRIRLAAFATAVIIALVALPHFDLLFVPAYPTSFFTSPTEFAATSIAHGSKLFAANCTTCHGADARGDGPTAASLPLPPADLTAEHLWGHSDGELFWYISHGIAMPDGSPAMPAFAGTLSDEGVWDIVDYLRAHNAGQSLRRSGKWSHPMRMPQFDVTCADGRTIDLDDLRGRVLRLVVASEETPIQPIAVEGADVATIVITRNRRDRPINGACIATESETWTALAIILGLSSDTIAGTELLADPDGWLRMAWRPTDGKPDSRALASAVRDVTTHPIVAAATTGHVHRN